MFKNPPFFPVVSKSGVSEYADDGCQASERVNGLVAHAHGNGREALNHPLFHGGDGDAHLDHVSVGDDVRPLHEYGDARAVHGKDIKHPLSSALQQTRIMQAGARLAESERQTLR